MAASYRFPYHNIFARSLFILHFLIFSRSRAIPYPFASAIYYLCLGNFHAGKSHCKKQHITIVSHPFPRPHITITTTTNTSLSLRRKHTLTHTHLFDNCYYLCYKWSCLYELHRKIINSIKNKLSELFLRSLEAMLKLSGTFTDII